MAKEEKKPRLTPDEARQRLKAIRFGIWYGLGPERAKELAFVITKKEEKKDESIPG